MTTPKPRGRRAPVDTHGAAGLLKALRFVGQVAKSDSILEQHCFMGNNRMSATDGIITIGCNIEEGYSAMPHTKTFIEALEKCKEEISIVVEDSFITVKSGKSKFKVQCAPRNSLPTGYPDSQICPIDDSVRVALKNASVYTKEGELYVAKASVVLDAYCATGTNGFALIQHRHACNLPPSLALPKRFVDLAFKHSEQLTGFGYTENKSATFWFSDGSFIKCQLFTEALPDYNRLFNVPINAYPIPDGFWDGLRSCVPFGDNATVEFVNDGISSFPVKASSAFHEVAALPVGKIFNGKLLLQIEELVDSADFSSSPNHIIMFGPQTRLILMCKVNQ